ncbi:hypothetical protein BDZ91DRAFT_699006 [Kalaharituber pfeilii]|nr:hypothetical protein BDZ91DRAFT_699006 [Kalaharituber pfeilii]
MFGYVHAWVGALLLHPFNRNSIPTGVRARAWTYSLQSFKFHPQRFDSSLACCTPDNRATFIRGEGDNNAYIFRPFASQNPRRVWDICSHKVIPGIWLSYQHKANAYTCIKIWAISHAWVEEADREYIWTSVNNFQWPVPVPKGVTLESIREDLIRLGCRYAWLDVLCLRQEYPKHLPHLREERHSLQEWEWRNRVRQEEWKIDVPTIGFIYTHAAKVVIYFNGLGRAFNPGDWKLEDQRHWLNRAWTLQETIHLSNILVGGVKDRTMNPLNTKIDRITTLGQRLAHLSNLRDQMPYMEVIKEMVGRYATYPVDKVQGLISIITPGLGILPIYTPNESPHEAWNRWMYGLDKYHQVWPQLSFAHILIMLFPHPSAHHWFPSWDQVLRFPDISLGERLGSDYEIRHPDQGAMLFSDQLHGILYHSMLYRSCTLRRSGNMYETCCQRLKVFLHSTLQNGFLPDVGIKESQTYALVDITLHSDLCPPDWEDCRWLLVCQELEERDDLHVEEGGYNIYLARDGLKYIRLRRVTTLLYRGGERKVKLPFPCDAGWSGRKCYGPRFSIE